MTDDGPRAALAAIGQLTDAEIDIGNAALQLASVDAPDADWQDGGAAPFGPRAGCGEAGCRNGHGRSTGQGGGAGGVAGG